MLETGPKSKHEIHLWFHKHLTCRAEMWFCSMVLGCLGFDYNLSHKIRCGIFHWWCHIDPPPWKKLRFWSSLDFLGGGMLYWNHNSYCAARSPLPMGPQASENPWHPEALGAQETRLYLPLPHRGCLVEDSTLFPFTNAHVAARSSLLPSLFKPQDT